MPDLSNTTIVVIVIAVVLIVALIVFGKRLKNFSVEGPGGIKGSASGGTPGATISETTAAGNVNQVLAKGDNATVAKSQINGDHNIFKADSSNT